ncbi:MAG: hypothetical protein ABSA76_06815, partial [Bacteroidales bacterium]
MITINSTAQLEKTETYFENGQLQSKGILHLYSTVGDNVPKKYRDLFGIKKKDKKWEYWYKSGQLERIEHYNLGKYQDGRPVGKWEYFNEQGIKYRVDYYKHRAIYNSKKEIYRDSILIGKIVIHNGIPDTTLLTPVTFGKNLIMNPYFDIFLYKPIPIIYNGQSMLEEWIPWWKTPGRFTPDFISNIRMIDSLDYDHLLDTPLPNKFNFIGLALYKDSDSYSEYIQGKLAKPLIKGHKYCFKAAIALSSYSRYSVDHLGVLFSKMPINIVRDGLRFWDGTYYKPQIYLSLSQTLSDHFTTLCDCFVSSEGGQYITLGRFSSRDSLKLVLKENIPHSHFGLEKSAYYLIDQVELFEIQDTLECNCKSNIDMS